MSKGSENGENRAIRENSLANIFCFDFFGVHSEKVLTISECMPE